MKSGKQRRQDIKAKRLAKQTVANERAIVSRAAEQAKLHAAASGERVDTTALAPDGSYSVPDFVAYGYYVNRPFVCQDCGKAEVWTTTQQKWWYEVAKGGVWTTARRCRPCRRQERERRDEARRVHLEGLARQQDETCQGYRYRSRSAAYCCGSVMVLPSGHGQAARRYLVHESLS